MALKLGVQNVSDIVPCLKQKLANLKEKDIDKYTKIMNMGTKSGEQELVVWSIHQYYQQIFKNK